MVCRYKYCPNDKKVDKDKAIKEGSAYYCPECYNEKQLKREIEDYYNENLPATSIMILRKVINQLLYTNKYEATYILFVLKKIHINSFRIYNAFGLVNYCNDGRNIEEWKKQQINKEYKNMKNNLIQYDIDDKKKFIYKPIIKKYTDLI
jgi:NAD-dependent SIR2 family protein deacetylase